MTTGARVARALLIGFAIVALSGCAAAVPSAAPSSSVEPTTRPTATQSAVPTVRVPLGCSDLFSSADAAKLTGAPATLQADEGTAPTDMTGIATRQYGALTCHWEGAGTDDIIAYVADLDVSIAPDAAGQFEANFAPNMSYSFEAHATPVENTAGDRSGYWCITDIYQNAGGLLPDCVGQMLVGKYWVTVTLNEANANAETLAAGSIRSALSTVATKLSSAGSATPAWIPPSSKASGFCANAQATAQVRSALGDAALAPVAASESTTILRAYLVAQSASAFATCSWQESSGPNGTVSVSVLAGGSWAFPGFAPVATGDSLWNARPYAPVTVPGATSATMACAQGACDAFLAVGTSAVEVILGDLGSSRTIAALAALATDIQSS